MRGLALGISLCIASSVLGLTACAARSEKGLYAMPETTEVRLKEPCKLSRDGKSARGCKFVLLVHGVKVR
jgi:hypothetical protein